MADNPCKPRMKMKNENKPHLIYARVLWKEYAYLIIESS